LAIRKSNVEEKYGEVEHENIGRLELAMVMQMAYEDSPLISLQKYKQN
jgi:hypothetical protein